MKKQLALLLVIVLLLNALLALVSCQKDTPPEKPDNGENIDAGKDEGGEKEEGKSEVRISIDYLPNEKYGTEDAPAQFHIFNWTCGTITEAGTGWIPWEEADVERLDGSNLGEAVFNRNAAIEEKYGLEITSEYGFFGVSPDYMSFVRADSQNGDGAYQLLISRTFNLVNLLREDHLYDMNLQEKYLHTDQPWWVQDSVTSYTLGNSLYAACTEMLMRDKGAAAALCYNKELAKDYADLPDFYELVEKNSWTMEALIEACDLVDADIAGGWGMNSADDIYGMFGYNDQYLFYNAFGYKFAHINEDGYVEYDFAQSSDDGTIALLQEIFTNILYADWYFNISVRKDVVDGDKIFTKGNALFSSGLLKRAATEFNSMKDEFGILPYPLFNELQENYSSLVYPHYDSVVGIPKATTVAHGKGAEFSAVILEALSWESYYGVSPVFYEEILYARAAKDKKDVDMIKLIMDTRSYDPGQYYDVSGGGIHGSNGYGSLTSDGSSDIASVFEQYGDVSMEMIQKINNLVDGKGYND